MESSPLKTGEKVIENTPKTLTSGEKRRRKSEPNGPSHKRRKHQLTSVLPTNFLKYTKPALKTVASFVDFIGETMNAFKDVVKQKIEKGHLQEWHRLNKKRIALRTETFKFATALKVSAGDYVRAIEKANKIEDLEGLMCSFSETKMCNEGINYLIDLCIDLSVDLKEFEIILKKSYPQNNKLKNFAIYAAVAAFGAAFCVIKIPAIAAAASVAGVTIMSGGVTSAPSTAIWPTVKLLEKIDVRQLERLKVQVKKDRQICRGILRNSAHLKSLLQEFPPMGAVKLVQERLINRFVEISKFCDELTKTSSLLSK